MLAQQQLTQSLLHKVVSKILNIEYANYEVFGKTAEDDAIVRGNRQHEHDAFVLEVADIVEREAKGWEFAAILTTDQYNRLKLINELLTNALNAAPVRLEKLRKALTASELTAYDESLRQPANKIEALYVDGMPDELKGYNRRLHDADFLYYKYEKMSGLQSVGRATYKHGTLKKTYHQAENKYANALEYLEEQIELSIRDNRQDELLRWLDRDVSLGIYGNLSPDVDGVPRVKGSRSHSAQDSALPKMGIKLKRQQRILESLLTAAVTIAYVPDIEAEAEQQRNDEQIKARMTRMRAAADRFGDMNSERD